MIRDRELQKVSRDSFMAENRPRVFNGRADIEVFALRIVSGNEIETARVLVVNAGRIHEAAGAGWLERLGQLPDFKVTEIRREGDQLVLFEEADHFRLATFVGFQKIVLIFWDRSCSLRIWIGQRGI